MRRPGLRAWAAALVALAALAPASATAQSRYPPWDRFGPDARDNDAVRLQVEAPGHGHPLPSGARYHPRYGHWWPGQTLPADAPATVVAYPARFHLRPAPPGYVWLLCDGDLMLASSASGLIVEVIPAGAY
jgi:Ni/Co efflux regulator RcnB